MICNVCVSLSFFQFLIHLHIFEESNARGIPVEVKGVTIFITIDPKLWLYLCHMSLGRLRAHELVLSAHSCNADLNLLVR